MEPQDLTTEDTEKYFEHSERPYAVFYIKEFLSALCGLRLSSVSSLRSAYCWLWLIFLTMRAGE